MKKKKVVIFGVCLLFLVVFYLLNYLYISKMKIEKLNFSIISYDSYLGILWVVMKKFILFATIILLLINIKKHANNNLIFALLFEIIILVVCMYQIPLLGIKSYENPEEEFNHHWSIFLSRQLLFIIKTSFIVPYLMYYIGNYVFDKKEKQKNDMNN